MLYAVGSLVCALAPIIEIFVFARVLQGLARELWLQTENLWCLWPGFIGALRAAR